MKKRLTDRIRIGIFHSLKVKNEKREKKRGFEIVSLSRDKTIGDFSQKMILVCFPEKRVQSE